VSRRGQPSGMGVKQGRLAYRPPVGVQTCRGCDVAVTAETAQWDAERKTFVCVPCGIGDPCGLFGPMRPAPGVDR
jgi:hypothetical protein